MRNQLANADAIADGRGRSMLSVDDLSERWRCSTRHVRRMADAGRIPRPIKLGNLCRWPIALIEQWELDGCPNVRNANKRGRS
ncbi:helix-turn-helix transcriptional regulator [Aporhodopirellula rubra]|uniref:helix-turn-helix transcriptional regulator n=1 Tax=Aporhodopirellula rubra TaxID=980271 RepID=UPI0036F2A29E